MYGVHLEEHLRVTGRDIALVIEACIVTIIEGGGIEEEVSIIYYIILYFTFLFFLFVFVSAAGQYFRILTGPDQYNVIEYNIANSSWHFGPNGP